jgi:hypothetical protein
VIQGVEQRAIRDNVLLEFGMFLGRLGKRKSFFIRPAMQNLRLPSDLEGVVHEQYDAEFAKSDPMAALAPACVRIKGEFSKQLRDSIDRQRLNQIVQNALEAICRAMSVPATPHEASLRAFVFREEDGWLVCSHFWDPHESDEEVDKTRFKLDRETASKIVVVRCFLDDATRVTEENDTEAGEVGPVPAGTVGVEGRIKPDLMYVLAAPIRNADGTVWGVVDFDASNDLGISLLTNSYAKAVIFRLAKTLRAIFL